jgi:hypothetical protein
VQSQLSVRVRILWFILAGIAILIGCLGLLAGVPSVKRAISSQAEPEPISLSARGTYYDENHADITRPGRYAIWATKPTSAPDGARCSVVSPNGSAVSTKEPGSIIQWTEVGTDDSLWTWMATFDAPMGGSYLLSCHLDAGYIGQKYAVTSAPPRRLTFRLQLEQYQGMMVAALPAGLLILALTVVSGRRNKKSL